jgi:putative ABC transport system substrate-binding protein
MQFEQLRRREFITLLGGAAAAWPRALPAQPSSGKTYQIGFLGVTSHDANYRRRVDALRTGLRQLGYDESRNVVIHYRWADGRYDRLPELATELVKLGVDVLVTHSTPGALAARVPRRSVPLALGSEPYTEASDASNGRAARWTRLTFGGRAGFHAERRMRSAQNGRLSILT